MTTWRLPQVSLPAPERRSVDVDDLSRRLLKTLRELGAPSRLHAIHVGPTVIRFELEAEPETRMRDYGRLGRVDDLRCALACDSVRVQAPIPGTSLVGVEVTNPRRRVVALSEVAEAARAPLRASLGLTVDGSTLTFDLAGAPHTLCAAQSGGGKALDVSTQIPTPDGWQIIGNLKVGDRVFDENGIPCRVTHAFDVQHDRPCYEVVFSDGVKIVADADHQWLTWTHAARLSKAQRASRGTGEESKQSYRWILPSVVTTEKIRETLRVPTKYNGINHSVQLSQALQYDEKDLPIDPYVLGVWLGDGTSSQATITNPDPEIRSEIERRGYMTRDRKTTSTCPAYGVGNDLQKTLRKIEVLNDKHIPVIYLQGSVAQRMDLLRGLMDSDGYAKSSGGCEFYSVRKELASAVLELVCSLGIRATMREKRARLYDKDCGIVYTIAFSTTTCVFLLPRKAKRQMARKRRETQNWRYIVEVRPVHSRPVRCISVDSPSHLYLASRECIPTHNSSLVRSMLASLLLKASPDDLAIVAVDPKLVELRCLEGLPHMIGDVVYDPLAAVDALHWVFGEAEARYALIARHGCQDLAQYNVTAPEGRVPHLLVVIDELADLVLSQREQVETILTRIAQKGRAAGVHLLACTQSPKREIVTGVLRANLPARIALRCATAIDSRLVLEQGGAEQLLGRGDGILAAGDGSRVRFQSAYVSGETMAEIVEAWREQVHPIGSRATGLDGGQRDGEVAAAEDPRPADPPRPALRRKRKARPRLVTT